VDEVTDLAVVKINAGGYRWLPWETLACASGTGRSQLATLGFDSTVTLGIISTLKRPSNRVGIPDKRILFKPMPRSTPVIPVVPS